MFEGIQVSVAVRNGSRQVRAGDRDLEGDASTVCVEEGVGGSSREDRGREEISKQGSTHTWEMRPL